MADFQTSTQRSKWIFTPQKLAERYKAANQRAVQLLEKCGTTQVEVDASGLLTYPTEKGDAGSGDQPDKKLKPLSVDEERFMRVFYEAKVQEVCSAFEFPHKIQNIVSQPNSEHTTSELTRLLDDIESLVKKYKYPSEKDMKHINRKLKSCLGHSSSHDESKKREKRSKHKSHRSSSDIPKEAPIG
ncbi:hypothetical protein BRARA_F02854 [Brassica rapa]|uniref:Uncharacterized protein n=1 Tax=Brassica campestris TaxID=3711 RepID=A0A397Z634_BRACM|nr:hypothetical protein BRARA_F02854 [Brassica rapa]